MKNVPLRVRRRDLISARNAEGSSTTWALNLAGYRIVMIWINDHRSIVRFDWHKA